MGEHIHHFRFYSKEFESAKIAVGQQQLLCNKINKWIFLKFYFCHIITAFVTSITVLWDISIDMVPHQIGLQTAL